MTFIRESSLSHERTQDSALRSIQSLLSRFDAPFARRLYSLHEARKRQYCTSDAAWTAIGGLRGLFHLLSQGRLLTRILRQIRRQYPDKYEIEMDWIRGTNWMLALAALGTLRERLAIRFHPNMTCIACGTIAELFTQTAAEIEAICMDLSLSLHAEVSRDH